jgi:hypothetical protein
MMIGDIPTEWQDIGDDLRQVFSEGEEALRIHRAGLPRVIQIGRAFFEMQQEAMRRSHSDKPAGRRYGDAFAALVLPTPQLAKVNKTDRAQFVWCYQNREKLELWWPTLGENQRDRWGHPQVIRRQYVKIHGDQNNTHAAPKKTVKSELAAKVEELDALQVKLQRLERERDDYPLIARNDTAEDIARTLMEWLPPSKRTAVAAAMMRLTKSTVPQGKRPEAPKTVGRSRRAILGPSI